MKRVQVIGLVFFAGAAFSQPILSTDKKQQATEAAQPKADASQPVQNPASVIETVVRYSAENNPQQENKPSGISRVLEAVFAWLLKVVEDPISFFTLVLAFFTVRLWKSTHRLAVGAEDTAQRQLRAYVGIRPHDKYPASTLEEMHTIGLKFHIFNEGSTIAYGVHHTACLGRYTEDQPFEVDFTETASKFVLHPRAKSDMTLRLDAPLNSIEIQQILEGVLKFYVWGEIRYTDAFGVARFTRFRMRQAGGTMIWTEKGNDAS
ncbi:MAG: hypothetical protein H7332_03295 [Bdellovibrionales bacterium]|nr:hypothetical protein [Ramlibacter sp.]